MEKLVQKNMLRPLTSQRPLPNADPKLYCKYHQVIGHDTDTCIRLRHEVQNLIDAGKVFDPETRKPNTQNNPLPNYRNVPPPDAPILTIGTGLTEEQVFNSFVNPNSSSAKPESFPRTKRTAELSVHMIDLWSSDDDESGEPIDLWDDEEEENSQQIGKVEGKKSETGSETIPAEKAERSNKEAKKEEVIASVWELLMHSRDHREALVLALDQKKISICCTPEQMVGSLTETPRGAIIFSDEDLPLEGRDHQRALFIKAEVKGKMTCCVMVDNGSAINVCPLKILPKLELAVSDLKPSEVIIKAYDDTRRPVEGIF